MISTAEAEAIIRSHLSILPPENCPVSRCVGRVLRRPIHADRDQPPFSRVTMDGYAIRMEDWKTGIRKYRIDGMPQAAGTSRRKLTEAGNCIEIMTGAPLPEGSDAVIPYEDATSSGGFVAIAQAATATVGHSIHPLGSDFKAGDLLLDSGAVLSGKEIAVAVSAGASIVAVSSRPSIALISTGDELVDVGEPVAPHQIRRSNDYALNASLESAGYPRVERFHFRDAKDELENQLKRLLAEVDVLIVTGGVSKGKFDFLPSVLQTLGVEKKFQGIRQRPGKPFWFGVSLTGKPVFALPGNPVSAFVCLHRYVLPALDLMSSEPSHLPEFLPLGEAIFFKPELAYLLPVKRTVSADGKQVAIPKPVNTSGDYAGLIDTQGFVELPEDRTDFPMEYPARFWPWH